MKKLLFPTLLSVLLSLSAFAQKTYIWDHYHVQVSVPRDFRVTKNTDHDFEMRGDGMELAMHF
ncbi:MAG: hypothetical protein R2822_15290 [Spirosomataceae bacterium]